MNIKVKPLAWQTRNDKGWLKAETPIATFEIWGNHGGWILTWVDGVQHIGPFASLEQAKEFAQDFVEKMVMQLIEAE